MSRIDEVFERLYAEAIYSSSESACKRDMNDDLELIEAELCRLRAEAIYSGRRPTNDRRTHERGAGRYHVRL
jgi:hypothetical protein